MALRIDQLFERVQRMIERARERIDHNELLEATLDDIVDAAHADRGLIVMYDQHGVAFVVHARAPKRTLSPREQQEVSRTLIARARQDKRTLLWRPQTWSDSEGDAPPASALTLGIAAAIVVPFELASGAASEDERSIRAGALYLDYRDESIAGEVGESQKRFASIAANLISLLLENRSLVEVARAQLRETQIGAVSPTLSLDELTASSSMSAMRTEIEIAQRSEGAVLILGESGTGKTLIAQAIASSRGPKVVRAALGMADDLNTITSELFGHERGSFSGAFSKRIGLVEYADGGTLILDEIFNLPLRAQQLLLDFTQFGTYRPLGWAGAEPKRSNVRIIAVTNGDLHAAVADGRFRQDLFYRLASNVISIPPLRDRRSEIPSLAMSIANRGGTDGRWQLSLEARRFLASDELLWQGNFRQLEAAVQRAKVRATLSDSNATTIELGHFAAADLGSQREIVQSNVEPVLATTWAQLQRERQGILAREEVLIDLALSKHSGNISRVASDLGMPRTSLVSRLAGRRKESSS